MDFDSISTPFFCIVLDLSAPLVLVIFYNPSIRKSVSCRSKGIKFSTFSAFFVDFVSSSFFIRICEIFEAILSSIWHNFLEKNPSENHFKKWDPPPLENATTSPCPMAPRDAASYYSLIKATASRAHFSNRNNSSSSNSSSISARARIVVRICIRFWVDYSSKSKNCSKMAAWVDFEKFVENGCRSWFRLQKFRKQFEKMKGLISKLNADDLTRHWAETRRIFMVWIALSGRISKNQCSPDPKCVWEPLVNSLRYRICRRRLGTWGNPGHLSPPANSLCYRICRPRLGTCGI